MIKKNIFLLLKRLKGTYAEYKEIQRYFNQIVECLNDESTMLTFQKDHLQKLLLHAYQNVPFYTQRIKKMIRNDHDIDINEFYKIDLLKKKDVRNYKDELISGDIGARKWFYNTSGGSTGEPVVLIQDELCNRWGAASDKFYYERIIGIDEMAVKKVILWGSEIDIFRTTVSLKAKIVNWLRNQKILNSFRMSEKDMEKYTKIINSYKPDLIRAYAGSLYELCKFIEKRRISIHRPKVIVTSAEKLSGAMREKIESVFGTKVYDFYGSREVGGIAGECTAGLLHTFMFNNFVEVLNNQNQQVKKGDMGTVIVTTLHNYSMPLIRYVIGDMAKLGPKHCTCGCLLPTLKEVLGRISDHFVTGNNAIIHGEYFTHLFYMKDWVDKFQVVQEDCKKIRIYVVLHGNICENEKKEIENKIKLVMGRDCHIIWEFVKEIPKTVGGKYMYTKSLLSHGWV